MKLGPVFFAGLAASLPAALGAQRQASLGAGTGIVRYAGGSSFSALTVAPALQLVTPFTYVAASAAASVLQGGVWAGQARTDLWGATRRQLAGFRPALGVTLSLTTRSDGVAAGSGAALAEALGNTFAVGA